MPKARVTTLATRATILSSRSLVRGRKSMTSTPASGVKTPALSNQLSAVRCIRLLHGDDEDEGAEGSGTEEQGAVLLDPAGLHRPQRLPALLGGRAAGVHDAVDDALIDVLVHPVAGAATADADAVDDRIDERLVDVVGTPRDRALDAGDDHVLVEGVDVVLVPEERVARAGHLAATGEAGGKGSFIDGDADEVAHDGAGQGQADRQQGVAPVERGMGELGEGAAERAGLDPLGELLGGGDGGGVVQEAGGQ